LRLSDIAPSAQRYILLAQNIKEAFCQKAKSHLNFALCTLHFELSKTPAVF
jgi:hypothetical protein